jgi:hypothetical protein
MRYVPYSPSKIDYPPNWETDAAEARQCVLMAPPEKRSDEIKNHSKVWSSLKPALKRIVGDKCWYTEAPQKGTDTDVDHFRPKNAVRNARRPDTNERHPGYWWRAFDPSNYRYSCIVANRRRHDEETDHTGGKGEEFPIWDESQRAWCPEDDCRNEQPLLIDPCDPADVALITFAENGEATERHSESAKPRLYKKAQLSIELYHLNHSDFVKARIEIRDKLRQPIEDAQWYYQKLDTADVQTQNAYKRAIQQLREACNERAPFSSFAVAMLQPYRFDESLEPVFW